MEPRRKRYPKEGKFMDLKKTAPIRARQFVCRSPFALGLWAVLAAVPFIGCMSSAATVDEGVANAEGGNTVDMHDGGAGGASVMGGQSAGGAGVGGMPTSSGGGSNGGGSSAGGNNGGAGGTNVGGMMVGMGGTAGAAVASGATPPNTLMAVGYGGIRVVSTDGGLHWQKRAETRSNGGDDQDLLRAVAFGNGVWIAAGVFRIYTSTDTLAWTERSLPTCIESIAFGQGKFIAICGGSTSTSVNGISWTRGASIRELSGHTYITYAEGKFAAFGSEQQIAFVSKDGVAWSSLAGFKNVTSCNDTLKADVDCSRGTAVGGVYYRNQGRSISRSTNGQQWTTVYTDDHGNGLFSDSAYHAIGSGLSP
jgi:hypothetical protein